MNTASFDIWDTCLTRSFSEPKHVFFEVARRLHGHECFEAPETAELARLRVTAEQKARESAPGGECRFEEIAAVLLGLVGEDLASRFMELEVQVEKEYARPVLPMLGQVEENRTKGAAIVFISDMYLPGQLLQELLETHGFFKPGDSVFVSADHRANKYGGELFEIVRKVLGIDPARWTHWGDKLHADVLVPRRMGIRAIHYQGTEFTEAEIRAGEACSAQAREASRIKGGMRATRLSGIRPAVLTDVVAPWLCALAAQMVHRARDSGLSRLYFLSRDGEVLLRIAKCISPAELECRYLYSSRRAWCFPAMVGDDTSSRRWLETFQVSPRGILGSLDFLPEEQDGILSELKLSEEEAERRSAAEEREFVWEHLRATGRMERVLEKAALARQTCLAYLAQEGLFADDRWAICDVGWALNGQAALTRLLQQRNPTLEARGFYFMVNGLRPPVQESGTFAAWLLDEALDPGEDSIPRLLTCLSGLIEEFCLSSTDPSLKGYRADDKGGAVLPVFGSGDTDSATCEHASQLREAVDRLATEWQKELRDPQFLACLVGCTLPELLRFLRNPTRDEALAVSRLRHASEATNRKQAAGELARPLTFRDGLAIFARRGRLVRRSTESSPLWAAGCRAQTPAWINRFHSWMTRPLPRFRR